MLAKRKNSILGFRIFAFMVRELCYLLHMKPTAKAISSFFVTILLPTISNRWAFALIIRVILCCMYNMWQNIINSWQLWKKRKEIKLVE